jgi:hypothetical protein
MMASAVTPLHLDSLNTYHYETPILGFSSRRVAN